MEPCKTSMTRPPIMLVYGEHKIGKSTFAADAPSPIFVQTEDGLQNIETSAFPVCKTYKDYLDALDWVRKKDHAYKTLVIDTLDWTEHIMWEHICAQKGWEQIGDGPYGAGYKLALREWERMMQEVRDINASRNMLVILLAHAKIKRFEDPEREGYDRYMLDLYDKASDFICEAVDIIGFAAPNIATQSKKDGIVKAKIANAENVLHLQKSPAYEAGNRWGLNKTPLRFAAFSQALKEAIAARKNKGNLESVVVEKKGETKNG